MPPTSCFGFDYEHRDPAYEMFKPYPTVYYVKAFPKGNLVDGLDFCFISPYIGDFNRN